MGRLEGKVALITGAARGQGAAEARLFAAEGAKVVLGDVLDADGEKVASEIGESALYVHHDVSREDSWQQFAARAVQQFGGVDVLVNNAGVLHVAPIAQIELADYMRVIGINQVGCLLGMKTVVPHMAARGGGSIVNVASVTGVWGTAGLVAYAASKHAVLGMTKTAALELGRARIRVNALLPGGVDTPMYGGAREDWSVTDKSNAIWKRMPLRRIGEPLEMARAALFLASDDSSYCTGTQLLIDGGMTAGPLIF
jgi:3alpha(or 20beta)-hydroxysteroid dehydrogenase